MKFKEGDVVITKNKYRSKLKILRQDNNFCYFITDEYGRIGYILESEIELDEEYYRNKQFNDYIEGIINE